MIDAYTIGIQLTLENGVSDGLALVQRDLLETSRTVEGLTAGLAGLRQAADGLGAGVASEMARIAQDAQRIMALRSGPPSPSTTISLPPAGDETPQPRSPVPLTTSPPPRLREVPADPSALVLPVATETVQAAPIAGAAPRPTFQVQTLAAAPTPASPTPSTVQPLTPVPGGARSPTTAQAEIPRNRGMVGAAVALPDTIAPSRGFDAPQTQPLPIAPPAPPLPPLPHLAPRQPSPVDRVVPRQDIPTPFIAATISSPSLGVAAPAAPASPRPQPPEPVAPSAPLTSPTAIPVPLPSAAPRPSPQSTGPTSGDVYLDGTRLGRWISDRLARDASRPQAGGVAFDPRMTLAWPGAPIGH